MMNLRQVANLLDYDELSVAGKGRQILGELVLSRDLSLTQPTITTILHISCLEARLSDELCSYFRALSVQFNCV